ncbi:ferritin-like domain-containing protein [Pyxidicoccus trucidator]|uniref:ferritin-like domain-containing protein n=1 Tax=Pyxidicoccus trucidator TaxID=2709662 RepID=UPI0013DA9C67|nr:ferritin-like domain-containing protein [Pyxidicoccus trucidator]
MRSRMSRHLEALLPGVQLKTAAGARGTLHQRMQALLSEEPTLPPEFTWHDYAALLLHIAAEIEHALMAQYLYAAYSLGGPLVPAKHRERVRHWQEVVLGIAKEEMGHLITVQNVLRLIGAPLNLDREDYPWGSQFYSFDFTLEPLTKDSLARYVYAEMPGDWEGPEAEEVKKRAQQGNPSQQPLHRVGVLYDRLQKVLANPTWVKDADFQAATTTFQASWDEWGRGYMRGARGQATGAPRQATPDVIVQPVSNRDEAVAALAAVGIQGEALFFDSDADEKSHFRRFLDIYREYPDGEWTPTRPVPINPKTVMDLNANRVRVSAAKGRGAPAAPVSTVITHPESVIWAHLFNVRYRMLLMYLTHAYQLAGATGQGDTLTPRGLLINRTFGEMYNVRAISNILVELPLDTTGSGAVAAPPFEMPYTLDLPNSEADRWRVHRDLLEASLELVHSLHRDYPGRHTDYLRALEDLDGAALQSTLQMIPKP